MSGALRIGLLAGCALAAVITRLVQTPLAVSVADFASWNAPTPGALGDAVRALGVLAALHLAAIGYGTPFARLVAWLPQPLPAVARLALGFATLSAATLALAAAQQVGRGASAALLGVGAVLALAALVRGARPRLPRCDAPSALAWVGLGLALPAALAAFGPDPGWDALTYHLAIPERYLFAGGVVVSPWSVLSTYPHATAMLYLHAEVFDSVAAARLLHFEFGVLSAWLLWHAAHEASRRAGWLAAATLAACPLFAWELTVAYADLSATFYALLAVRALATQPARADEMRWAACAGLLAGAAAACRYPSWPLVPIVACTVLLPGTRTLAARSRAAALAFGTALLPLAPWLLRNAIFTGNPTAPLLQEWFSGSGPGFFDPGALAQNRAFVRSIGFGQGLDDLLRLPFDLSFRARLGDYTRFGFEIGALYGVALVAGLATLGLRREAGDRPSTRVVWWVAGLSTLVWFASAQDPRYLLPALALTAWGGAIAADRLLPARAPAWSWALPLALALLPVQLPRITALPHHLAVASGARIPEARPVDRLGDRLRASLPPDHRLVSMLQPLAYPLEGLDYLPHHLGNGSPLLLALHAAREANTVAAWFAELGATHVLLETRPSTFMTPHPVPGYSPDDFAGDLRALEAFLAEHATLEFSEGSLVVYRLEPRS